MAWDREKATYHLTPRGWQTGDPPPDDRVESWRYSYNQQSGWSKECVSWTCIWSHPGISRTERDRIREQHRAVMGTEGRSGNVITTIGQPL